MSRSSLSALSLLRRFALFVPFRLRGLRFYIILVLSKVSKGRTGLRQQNDPPKEAR